MNDTSADQQQLQTLEPKADSPLSTTENRILNTEYSSPGAPRAFPRYQNETPRAFSAFMTYFQLGHTRTLQAVADKLDEKIDTVKRWSSKFNWSERIHDHNAGALQRHIDTQAAVNRKHAAEWAERINEFREQEWTASQKLLQAAETFLETFGEDHLHKMTLAEVSRAIKTASGVGRGALVGVEPAEKAETQSDDSNAKFLADVDRVYGAAAQANATTTN